VEETVFEAAAAAYACVMPEDRSRGVALINIGSESTNLVVYDGDAMLRASTVPIAADHLTRDVAFGLTVSHDDAESLKREYGCAILGLTSDNSFIEVPSHDGRPAREASRKMLNTILEARAEELFLYVRNELARLHMDVQLLEGMVLTGGGALLNGMCDIAERVVNAPARNGLPVGILHWPEELNDPSWCVAAGLTMYSAKLKTRREWKRPAPGFLSVMKG
jgi:cell division protein FtsA